MKVNGRIINEMVGDLNCLLVALNTREVILMAKLKAMVYTLGPMVKYMTGSGIKE